MQRAAVSCTALWWTRAAARRAPLLDATLISILVGGFRAPFAIGAPTVAAPTLVCAHRHPQPQSPPMCLCLHACCLFLQPSITLAQMSLVRVCASAIWRDRSAFCSHLLSPVPRHSSTALRDSQCLNIACDPLLPTPIHCVCYY